METIYVTKNNCKSVLAYSKERFEKFKGRMPTIGYRVLTDKEVEQYLKKQGFEEAKPESVKKKPGKIIEPTKINIDPEPDIIHAED